MLFTPMGKRRQRTLASFEFAWIAIGGSVLLSSACASEVIVKPGALIDAASSSTGGNAASAPASQQNASASGGGAGSVLCGAPGEPTLAECCEDVCAQAAEYCPDFEPDCPCGGLSESPCAGLWAELYTCALRNTSDLFVCNAVGVQFRCGYCDETIEKLNDQCTTTINCVP